MKVEFTKEGKVSITAETKEENQALFDIVNSGGYSKLKKVAVAGTPKRHNKPRHSVECPVQGCDKSTKSLALHMLMAHGIDKSGKVHEEVEFSKGKSPVTQPVVALPNGTYKLRKMAGLLS